jgi:hypothetical protein
MSYEELLYDLKNLSIRDKEPIITIIRGIFWASYFNGNWIPCNNTENIFYFEYKKVLDLIIDYLDDERIIEWIFIYGDTTYIGVWNEAVFKSKQEILTKQTLRSLQHVVDGYYIRIKAVYD